MLEEVSREEKSGYKAEINTSQQKPSNTFSNKQEEKHDDLDNYGDDFEEDEAISEDLPIDDLLDSQDANRGGNAGG